MHVLISNDDGVDAPGIRVLAESLGRLGKVTIFAPDRDRSGASNSLTLDQPIRVTQQEEAIWRAAGTPTDCVHLALAGLLDFEPDIVVSGINTHANLGDDVIYSGTVAAAMEGRYLGLPAIAVSLCSRNHKPEHYASAARAAALLTERLLVDPLPADTILNVNAGPARHRRPVSGDARATGTVPGLRATDRPARQSGVLDRPAGANMPARGPILMPCAAVSSRSRRSTST